MNGGTKTGVRVQTTTKAEILMVGFRPALPIEEEKEKEGDKEEGEMAFIGHNKAHSRQILFSSTGLSVSDSGCYIR
jgi:hypothetical protein